MMPPVTQQVYADDQLAVRIVYTNYKGETGARTIRPVALWFGPTVHHPEPQWLLDAIDLDKGGVLRSFALKDVTAWAPVPPPPPPV